jgi:transcriptional regulator with XRE-family HTH domain
MRFPERLSSFRKQLGFTQQQMADKIGMHVSQLKRYEAGAPQPTIDVFWRIALALNVSADMRLFEPDERGPDERLKLQFEAVETMIADVLHMHDAKRWTQPAPPAKPVATKR